MLEEGQSIEEVPTLGHLSMVEELIEKINFGEPVKKKLMAKINHLKKETLEHSRFFSKEIIKILKKK